MSGVIFSQFRTRACYKLKAVDFMFVWTASDVSGPINPRAYYCDYCGSVAITVPVFSPEFVCSEFTVLAS